MSRGFKDLKVYQLAYSASMKIYVVTKGFPKEEMYSLTDQIRRSSRAVCANIGEGYRKRLYPKHFTSKMTDADGEGSETIIWLDFAKDCGYLNEENYQELYKDYEEIGKMLNGMATHPERFIPK